MSTSWPKRRFSQAISEGDGISVIPFLAEGQAVLAKEAEAAGAEALAVESVDDVRALRGAVALPLLVRRVDPTVEALVAAREAGADACVLVFDELAGEGELLEELVGAAAELGLDCGLDVRDEEEVVEVLERLDPEILVLSEREPDKGEAELERTLELLPDVPAGKLVVSESRVTRREQILELERAGVDAVLLLAGLPAAPRFAQVLAELTGRRTH